MTIVAILHDRVTGEKLLFNSAEKAAGWISETDLVDENGNEWERFNLDVCDDSCPNCGIYMSSEAWEEADDGRWFCPHCGETDCR
jgi:hypothetical protein